MIGKLVNGMFFLFWGISPVIHTSLARQKSFENVFELFKTRPEYVLRRFLEPKGMDYNIYIYLYNIY